MAPGCSKLGGKPTGQLRLALAVARNEAKQRFTWVRDLSNAPAIDSLSSREADLRVLPNGFDVEASSAVAPDLGLGQDSKVKQAVKGKKQNHGRYCEEL